MNKQILFYFLVLNFFSCNNKQENKYTDTEKNTPKDTLAPLQVTILANLPDSLQPKTILLKNMPKPLTVMVPKSVGGFYSVPNANGEVTNINLEPPVTVLSPVLKDEKGEVIKDKDGNPFILGDGCISNFTTYTTEIGLAHDAIESAWTDNFGNIWFGTKGGVSKYDGNSFINFNSEQDLLNITAHCIKEDKLGNLWFGTTGLILYDGKSFIKFTTALGLTNSVSVLSIDEDKAGNIWLATDIGVIRYDPKIANIPCIKNTCKHDLRIKQDLNEHNKEVAKSFSRFAPENFNDIFVSSIKVDKLGNLWFGSQFGVILYDGKSITEFSSAFGQSAHRINIIAEDKSGNLWFGSEGGGVYKYDGKRASLPCNSKTCKHDLRIPQDLEKHNKELAKSFTNYNVTNGLANNNVNCITEDKTGNLWFGTEGGISRYDGKCFTSFSTSQGLSNNKVRSITEDKAGNLWFGTDGGGVCKYAGKSFSSLATSQGLPDNAVYSITEDKTGNLWFGTYQGGVCRYDGKSFTRFNSAQGFSDKTVYSILEDKVGNLWFGTNWDGVIRYDGKSFTHYTSVQGLANNSVYSIALDKEGNLWFGTGGGGASRYDGKSFTNYTSAQGLAHNIVYKIIIDKADNLWFGTYGDGVSCYNGKTFTNYTSAHGLANNTFYNIFEDKKYRWFGSWGMGSDPYSSGKSGSKLCNTNTCKHNLQIQQDLEEHNKELSKPVKSFSMSESPSNNSVYNIIEDKAGNLWFGTAHGLSILDLESREKFSKINGKIKGEIKASTSMFKNFTTMNGLPDNFVTQMIVGGPNQLYVGTNAGMCEFIHEGTQWKIGQVFNSSYFNHLTGVNVGQNAMFKDHKGIIWIATTSEDVGLVRFDPSSLFIKMEPSKVIITNIKINEEKVDWYNLLPSLTDSTTKMQHEIMTYGKILNSLERDRINKKYIDVKIDKINSFYPLPESLILPFKHNNVSFDFLSTETGRNYLVRYQYFLEGYSKEWSPITEKTSAIFGNIAEGTYTFMLKARSPEGVWSKPVTYSFTILPPWYRTWSSYTIYALLFLFALRVFVKWRERNLRMDKEKLEHTVEIRTAEVVAEKKEVEKQKAVVEKEKQRSDELLLNILPEEVAEELKAKGSAEAKQFDEVTVMFTDFQGFTQISEKLTPSELVAEIHTCFKAFDNIITKYNIEKIKTIGDSYMCAGGLPVINKTNAADVVNATLEIQQFMQQHLQQRKRENKEPFEIRIGVHTGPVVAGIVGVKKYAYDIWGDTVNTASRMESSGEAGKVNISGSTYELVKDKFNCIHRGKIQAKNKGEIDMYFVESVSKGE